MHNGKKTKINHNTPYNGFGAAKVCRIAGSIFQTGAPSEGWFASALIGFAVFGEIPSAWTCLGAFILMGAIISLSYNESRRSLRKSINTPSYSKAV